MFTVIIPVTEITSLVINNCRIFSQDTTIRQIILVNIGSKFLEIGSVIKNVEVLQLFDVEVYKAISTAIKDHSKQSNIILLDSNIQVGKTFTTKLVRHYANNHLYTFKINELSGDSVTVDERVGNKITPAMFDTCAVAFSKKSIDEIGYFGDGDLIDLAQKMQGNGVTLKMLNQVLVHKVMNQNHNVIKHLERTAIPKQQTLTNADIDYINMVREIKKGTWKVLNTEIPDIRAEKFTKSDINTFHLDKQYKIVIPFYGKGNRPEILIAVVRNLFKQTKHYKNIEIVIHETGEESKLSHEFIEECKIRHKFTVLPNSFFKTWVVNTVVDELIDETDVVVVFDADVLVDRGWVEELLSKDPTKFWMGWRLMILLRQSSTNTYLQTGKMDYKNFSMKNMKDVLLPMIKWAAGGINVIPKDIFIELGGWGCKKYQGLGYGYQDNTFLYKLQAYGYFNDGFDNHIFNSRVFHLFHNHKTISHDKEKSYNMYKTLKKYTKDQWEEDK